MRMKFIYIRRKYYFRLKVSNDNSLVLKQCWRVGEWRLMLTDNLTLQVNFENEVSSIFMYLK